MILQEDSESEQPKIVFDEESESEQEVCLSSPCTPENNGDCLSGYVLIPLLDFFFFFFFLNCIIPHFAQVTQTKKVS